MNTPLKVVQMRETSLRNVAAKMRELADGIEAGDYGEVTCAGFVMLADEFNCFGWGDGVYNESNSPSVFLLFQAAVHRMAAEIESVGR